MFFKDSQSYYLLPECLCDSTTAAVTAFFLIFHLLWKKTNSFSSSHQFIGDHALTYKGCHSVLNHKMLRMFVPGIGVGDISEIEQISLKKVLSVLVNLNRIITPKQAHYNKLKSMDIGYDVVYSDK